MSKEYLKYLFKSKKGLCIFIWIVNILNLISLTMSDNLEGKRSIFSLFVACVLLGIETIVIVPLFYNFIHSKKAVDTYFSLPVTRKQLLVTSQLFINISILAPFIVMSIASLIIGIKDQAIASPGAFALVVLFAVLTVIVFIAFETSIFVEANSTFDGVVLIGSYFIMPLFVYIAVSIFNERFIAGINPLYVEKTISYISLPTSIFICEGNLANRVMECSGDCSIFMHSQLVLLICLALHMLVSVYALKKNFIERKVERAETISNRFFSYPFVICFYTAILLLITTMSFIADSKGMIRFDIAESLIYIGIFVFYMIAKFIYKRKIEFKLKDITFFVVALVVSLLLSSISFKAKGFNLYNLYDHNPNNIAIHYDGWYDEGEIFDLVKKKAPEIENVYVMFEIVVDQKDMETNKELVDYIESIRQKSIDSFYNQSTDCNYLSIMTNYDEKNLKENGYYSSLDNDRAYYAEAPSIPLSDILKYKDHVHNFYIDTYTSNDNLSFSLDDLVANNETQS